MQLSNARDVADSRDEIVEKVKSICLHVMKLERQQRENLKKKNNVRLEDKISRSLGVLKYAKRMPLREADLLIGDVWLGKDLDMIHGMEDIDFLNLLTTVQDSTLQMINGEEKNKSQLNIVRAEYIKNFIKDRGVSI
jgi:protein arginine kinase